jgi:hypothetical protein
MGIRPIRLTGVDDSRSYRRPSTKTNSADSARREHLAEPVKATWFLLLLRRCLDDGLLSRRRRRGNLLDVVRLLLGRRRRPLLHRHWLRLVLEGVNLLVVRHRIDSNCLLVDHRRGRRRRAKMRRTRAAYQSVSRRKDWATSVSLEDIQLLNVGRRKETDTLGRVCRKVTPPPFILFQGKSEGEGRRTAISSGQSRWAD